MKFKRNLLSLVKVEKQVVLQNKSFDYTSSIQFTYNKENHTSSPSVVGIGETVGRSFDNPWGGGKCEVAVCLQKLSRNTEAF